MCTSLSGQVPIFEASHPGFSGLRLVVVTPAMKQAVHRVAKDFHGVGRAEFGCAFRSGIEIDVDFPVNHLVGGGIPQIERDHVGYVGASEMSLVEPHNPGVVGKNYAQRVDRRLLAARHAKHELQYRFERDPSRSMRYR